MRTSSIAEALVIVPLTSPTPPTMPPTRSERIDPAVAAIWPLAYPAPPKINPVIVRLPIDVAAMPSKVLTPMTDPPTVALSIGPDTPIDAPVMSPPTSSEPRPPVMADTVSGAPVADPNRPIELAARRLIPRVVGSASPTVIFARSPPTTTARRSCGAKTSPTCTSPSPPEPDGVAVIRSLVPAKTGSDRSTRLSWKPTPAAESDRDEARSPSVPCVECTVATSPSLSTNENTPARARRDSRDSGRVMRC